MRRGIDVAGGDSWPLAGNIEGDDDLIQLRVPHVPKRDVAQARQRQRHVLGLLYPGRPLPRRGQ